MKSFIVCYGCVINEDTIEGAGERNGRHVCLWID